MAARETASTQRAAGSTTLKVPSVSVTAWAQTHVRPRFLVTENLEIVRRLGVWSEGAFPLKDFLVGRKLTHVDGRPVGDVAAYRKTLGDCAPRVARFEWSLWPIRRPSLS